MHASVNYRRVPPERMEEAIRTYRDSTLPAVRSQQGFKGALILADRNAGKTIAIALWETEAHLRSRTPTTYVDAISGGPPIREVYQVSAYDRPESEVGKATHARVNTRQIQVGKMDDAIRTYQETTLPAARARNGFQGGLVLTDRSSGKVIAISLWDTEANMNATTPGSDVDDISVGPPTREIYEVSAEA